MKAIVGLAVEKALLEMGKPELEQISERLSEKYHCQIFDCYENPQYLNQILKELYGNSYKAIVEKIQKNIGEFHAEKSVTHFLKIINQ